MKWVGGWVGVGTCGAIGVFLQSGSDPRAELSDLSFVLKPIVEQKDRAPVLLVTNDTTNCLGQCERKEQA